MNVKEIGETLVQLCRQGKNMESINRLYAEEVESVEAAKPPLGERVTKGIEGVRQKNMAWSEMNIVNSHGVEGPYPHGDDRFAVRFSYDVTQKASGQRMKLDEIALFTLAHGKIVREEFFYQMG